MNKQTKFSNPFIEKESNKRNLMFIFGNTSRYSVQEKDGKFSLYDCELEKDIVHNSTYGEVVFQIARILEGEYKLRKLVE